MHTILTSHFSRGVQESGEFAGRRYLKLDQYANDKCLKLSLSNPWIRAPKENVGRLVENPEDPLCTVTLFESYVYSGRFLPSGYDGRLFRRKASKKELRNRQASLNLKNEPFYEANVTPQGVVGKNSVGAVVKSVATRCGFDNFETHTGRSNRRRGITVLSADQGVNQAEMNDVARHGGTKNGERISGEYQETTTKSSDNRMKATLYKGGYAGAVSVQCCLLLLLIFVSHRLFLS